MGSLWMAKRALGFLILFTATSGWCASWQIEPFLKSIEGTPYKFKFLVEGLESVSSIQFSQDEETKYFSFKNRITFTENANDGYRRLKSLEKWSFPDFSSLLHEAFHAFRYNLIDRREEYDHYALWMKRRSKNLYQVQELSPGDRYTALDEAYAIFIEEVLGAFFHANTVLDNKNGNCEHQLRHAKDVWKNAWTEEVKGYYYLNGATNYWAEQFQGLKILFSEGKKAYNRYRIQDKMIYTKEALSPVDKSWIARHIFEGRFQESFEENFAAQIKSCSISQYVQSNH